MKPGSIARGQASEAHCIDQLTPPDHLQQHRMHCSSIPTLLSGGDSSRTRALELVDFEVPRTCTVLHVAGWQAQRLAGAKSRFS